MNIAYVAEFIGTALIILFGSGLLAGLSLNKSLSKGGNWITICLGWGFAVMIGIFASGKFSGAHLNPAVTIGLAIDGTFPWVHVIPYIIAQMLGAFFGASVIVLHYYPHFKATPKDELHTLGIFSTGPAIKNTPFNLLSEIIATCIFVFALLSIGANEFAKGINPLIVGFLITAIGLSFGPTTGFALNPARDLGPRLAYAILPIPNKGDANWGYAWVPIVGPIIGAVLAVLLHGLIF